MRKLIPSKREGLSVEDRQSRRPVQAVRFRETGLERKIEQLGFLPTAQYPLLYRGLGKNGYGLFLYLEAPLDLQTLNRLAKCTDRTAVLKCPTQNRIGSIRHAPVA